jgi:hypothetical protein
MCNMNTPTTNQVSEALTAVSAPERRTIEAIVERAAVLFPDSIKPRDRLDVTMDLIACHMVGCRLDLAKLLRANVLDFSHDVFGIRRHLNRETGELFDCFLPRCATTREITPSAA